MTTYTELPDWQDGDLLAASRLNAMATNIDVAVGLDEQRVWPTDAGADVLNCGIYSRASDARFSGQEVEYYMAHNGDTLVFLHGTSGVSSSATLTYGSQTFSNLDAWTYHYLPLAAQPRYKIVKVRITSSPENRLFVRGLYAYQSNAAVVGTMPDFVNGATSSASDLNTVMAGTKRAITQLNQPIAGMYSVSLTGDHKELAVARNGYIGYIRHKHDKLYLWFTYACDGYGPNDYMQVTYNNSEIYKWQPSVTGNQYTTISQSFNVPAGLSVGSIYPLEFRMYWANASNQRVTVWAAYETPSTANANASAVHRWTHGDTANGDAGGPPQLNSMSEAINGIGTLRWTNPSCRAAKGWIPNKSGSCSANDEEYDELASIRVHRWLAYENIAKTAGGRETVTLQYQSGSGFSSVTLPTVTSPWFYDLDNTPIKPGMYFRVLGSKFLLQTPGYEVQ